MSLSLGIAVEKQVKQYLIEQGLQFITNNYHSHSGEIDLIMMDGEYLVFVEVRSRGSTAFGTPAESVTFAKQKKIIKTALHYMTVTALLNKCPARFDVVAVGVKEQIDWIKNAFSADYFLRF
jgi:putative endonuclease